MLGREVSYVQSSVFQITTGNKFTFSSLYRPGICKNPPSGGWFYLQSRINVPSLLSWALDTDSSARAEQDSMTGFSAAKSIYIAPARP